MVWQIKAKKTKNRSQYFCKEKSTDALKVVEVQLKLINLVMVFLKKKKNYYLPFFKVHCLPHATHYDETFQIQNSRSEAFLIVVIMLKTLNLNHSFLIYLISGPTTQAFPASLVSERIKIKGYKSQIMSP